MVSHGSNYVSKELKVEMEASGIEIDEEPIEIPGAIGRVERYHAPLREAFDKVKKEAGKYTSDA